MLNTNILSEKLEFVELVVKYTNTNDETIFSKIKEMSELIASKEKRFNGKSIAYMFKTLRWELLGV